MSAEELRTAATTLRKRAQAAGGPQGFPQPWGVRDTDRETIDSHGIATLVTCEEGDGEVTDYIDPDCATYIAMMDPGLGHLLADWLDKVAVVRAEAEALIGSTAWTNSTYEPAFVIARQINGAT